ncbi:hypothetical protein Hanom_Chr14g01315261 [Helianthus anomalus]
MEDHQIDPIKWCKAILGLSDQPILSALPTRSSQICLFLVTRAETIRSPTLVLLPLSPAKLKSPTLSNPQPIFPKRIGYI